MRCSFSFYFQPFVDPSRIDSSPWIKPQNEREQNWVVLLSPQIQTAVVMAMKGDRKRERERLMGSELERKSVWIWGFLNCRGFNVRLKTFLLLSFHFLVSLLTLCNALSCRDSKWQFSFKVVSKGQAWGQRDTRMVWHSEHYF